MKEEWFAEAMKWQPFKERFEEAARKIGDCLAGQDLDGNDHSCELCENKNKDGE